MGPPASAGVEYWLSGGNRAADAPRQGWKDPRQAPSRGPFPLRSPLHLDCDIFSPFVNSRAESLVSRDEGTSTSRAHSPTGLLMWKIKLQSVLTPIHGPRSPCLIPTSHRSGRFFGALTQSCPFLLPPSLRRPCLVPNATSGKSAFGSTLHRSFQRQSSGRPQNEV